MSGGTYDKRDTKHFMPKDFSHHFRALIEPHLPPDSRIVIPPGGPDLVIMVTWRLSTDPARPTKRSRMIRIVISEEALDDYRTGSDGVRQASDQRLLTWLQRKLAVFDPHHDAPIGTEPTPVTWNLATLELNA
jgi:hypothetical protein